MTPTMARALLGWIPEQCGFSPYPKVKVLGRQCAGHLQPNEI
jgi:hypothetical protein